MIHLFINSLAASAGGGLTYIRNVIPYVARQPGLKTTVALSPKLGGEFRGFANVDFLEVEGSSTRRVWFEQSALPALIRRCGAEVLLSTGNFALRNSPVPQILLSRNSIYTSADFYRDLRSRHEYRLWLDTHVRSFLAKRSIHWAHTTVAPSEAFAGELRRWAGMPVRAILHGFDPEAFTSDSTLFAPEIDEKLRSAEGSIKLLFVSHYNYYRNFETLIRALPLLRDRMEGRPVKLLLTCKLGDGENPRPYNPEFAARLVKQLGVNEMVVQLGTIPYSKLHQLYRRADIYVTPAYTETFAHPLVEAMACGVPVVASDLEVHREICRDAAVYFPKFSSEVLAQRVALLIGVPEICKNMGALGLERSRQFSWEAHVEEILRLSHTLIESKVSRATN